MGIFAFINTWNDLLWALVAITRQTLPVKRRCSRVSDSPADGSRGTVAILVVFTLLQKQFVWCVLA